jgi:hypothetical protein
MVFSKAELAFRQATAAFDKAVSAFHYAVTAYDKTTLAFRQAAETFHKVWQAFPRGAAAFSRSTKRVQRCSCRCTSRFRRNSVSMDPNRDPECHDQSLRI